MSYKIYLYGMTDRMEENFNNNSNLSDKTVILYLSVAKSFLISDPNIYDIESYNNFLGKTMIKKDKRCNNYYYALRKFIKFAIDEPKARAEILKRLYKPVGQDPKTLINKIRLSKKKRLEVIMNMSNLKHQLIALIQFWTGLRIGDVLNIKRGNIKYEDYEYTEGSEVKSIKCLHITTVGKWNKSVNKYIFDEDTVHFLLSYVTDYEEKIAFRELNKLKKIYPWEEYYFLTKVYNKNHYIHADVKERSYDYYVKELKIALSTSNVDTKRFASHDFRRCFASDVYEGYGKDPLLLMEMLNHSSMETTMRYLTNSGLNTKDVYRRMQSQS